MTPWLQIIWLVAWYALRYLPYLLIYLPVKDSKALEHYTEVANYRIDNANLCKSILRNPFPAATKGLYSQVSFAPPISILPNLIITLKYFNPSQRHLSPKNPTFQPWYLACRQTTGQNQSFSQSRPMNTRLQAASLFSGDVMTSRAVRVIIGDDKSKCCVSSERKHETLQRDMVVMW